MVKGLAEDAVELPWLSPCAASLVTLAAAPCAVAWSRVAADPGCALLLIRHAFPPLEKLGLGPVPLAFQEADALQAAKNTLQQIAASDRKLSGFADWNQPTLKPLWQASLLYARVAQQLAQRSQRCNADLAWLAGLLAPLGWLALATVAPQETSDTLQVCRWTDRPAALQRQRFGLDYAAVARRLNRCWRLPGWLATVTGHLALPLEIAVGLGADWYLFPLVQLAVGLVEEQQFGLKLACGSSPAQLCQKLELDAVQVRHWFQETLTADNPAEELRWENPGELDLLPDLLQLAADRRRERDAAGMALLQQQLDALHDALLQNNQVEDDSLRRQKLMALAEFAAGAAHEINNPLAVISGQAQYLLGRETDLDRRENLHKIIRQTQRIHTILTDVLLFARPAPPKRQPFDVGILIRDVANSVQSLADERKVSLVLQEPAAPLLLYADRDQISLALTCLLRNAIEAAPAEGWAGIRVETPGPELLHLIVEDNGRGPPPAQRDMLFDPFFSGRNAGRGRGLGLPIAWRLARLHDGDVTLAESSPGPTRFVLSLPLTATPAPAYHRNGTAEPFTLPFAATG